MFTNIERWIAGRIKRELLAKETTRLRHKVLLSAPFLNLLPPMGTTPSSTTQGARRVAAVHRLTDEPTASPTTHETSSHID